MTYRTGEHGFDKTPSQGRGAPRPLAWYHRVLEDGYFQGERRCIKGDLLTQTADHVAKDLGDSGLTSTQLRRFFRHVRSVERELEQKDFSEVVPQLQMLLPLVANYVGRGKNWKERNSREVFKSFVDRNVELATESKKAFKGGLIPHFESVIAYYKYHFPNK